MLGTRLERERERQRRFSCVLKKVSDAADGGGRDNNDIGGGLG